ncbi:MAG: hypothetical protein KDH96_05895 [Candidatus Riesia sp.]|nr:hypothetical protein [Candidatus Riesia sp.]
MYLLAFCLFATTSYVINNPLKITDGANPICPEQFPDTLIKEGNLYTFMCLWKNSTKGEKYYLSVYDPNDYFWYAENAYTECIPNGNDDTCGIISLSKELSVYTANYYKINCYSEPMGSDNEVDKECNITKAREYSEKMIDASGDDEDLNEIIEEQNEHAAINIHCADDIMEYYISDTEYTFSCTFTNISAGGYTMYFPLYRDAGTITEKCIPAPGNKTCDKLVLKKTISMPRVKYSFRIGCYANDYSIYDIKFCDVNDVEEKRQNFFATMEKRKVYGNITNLYNSTYASAMCPQDVIIPGSRKTHFACAWMSAPRGIYKMMLYSQQERRVINMFEQYCNNGSSDCDSIVLVEYLDVSDYNTIDIYCTYDDKFLSVFTVCNISGTHINTESVIANKSKEMSASSLIDVEMVTTDRNQDVGPTIKSARFLSNKNKPKYDTPGPVSSIVIVIMSIIGAIIFIVIGILINIIIKCRRAKKDNETVAPLNAFDLSSLPQPDEESYGEDSPFTQISIISNTSTMG